MAEADADYDGSSRAEDRAAERIEDDFIPDDALPLCAKCLKPCTPLQYYCDKCGSYDAINPLTPYIAFVNVPFNYGIYCTMLRKMLYSKETRILTKLFYLFLTALRVGGVIVIFVLPIFLVCKIPQGQLRSMAIIALAVIVIVLLVFYAYSGWPTTNVSIPIDVGA